MPHKGSGMAMSISGKKKKKSIVASVFQMVGLANNWSILIRSYVGHTNVMEQWR